MTIDSTAASRTASFVPLDELDIRPGSGVTARKTIQPDGPYQAGHYPGFPLFPGMFLVEAAREAVAAYVRETTGDRQAAVVLSLDSVRFASPVRPGDVVVVDVVCTDDGGTLKAKARCSDADGGLAAKISLSFRLQEISRD